MSVFFSSIWKLQPFAKIVQATTFSQFMLTFRPTKKHGDPSITNVNNSCRIVEDIF